MNSTLTKSKQKTKKIKKKKQNKKAFYVTNIWLTNGEVMLIL